jgi:hypothetical protein
VPAYNTLTVEGWGGGSGSSGVQDSSSNLTGPLVLSQGGTGGTTSVSTLSLQATGGVCSNRIQAQRSGVDVSTGSGTGTGGTATGGTTNTSGSAGGAASVPTAGTTPTAGSGAAAPGGGGAAVSGGTDANNLASTRTNGTAGNAPGGGASGGVNKCPSSGYASPGGASGAYFSKTYTFGAVGAPAVGDLLAYAVGAGGLAGTTNQSATGAYANGAAGGAGRVKFTVA